MYVTGIIRPLVHDGDRRRTVQPGDGHTGGLFARQSQSMACKRLKGFSNRKKIKVEPGPYVENNGSPIKYRFQSQVRLI